MSASSPSTTAAGTITAQIWNNLNRKLPEFDQGLSALIEDLDQRGLLGTTLVVALGEFGRTPIINREVGRDHWGPAASLLFAGAGVRGGMVLGQTDRRGAHVTRRPVAPADVAYTIYDAVGVDPHRWLMHPEGRPVEILDRGEPVANCLRDLPLCVSRSPWAARIAKRKPANDNFMRRILSILLLAVFAILPSTAQDKKKPAAKPNRACFWPFSLSPPGKTTRLILRGSHLDDAKEVKIDAALGSVKILSKGKAGVPDKNPDKVGDTQIEIELKLHDKIAADTVSLMVVTPAGESKPHPILTESKFPVSAEKEPNDGLRMAQGITFPIVIEGTIGRPNDVDVFRFDGKRGQKLQAEVLASRYGSPLDAILYLYDAKGEQLASNDDFDKAHRDAKIEAVLTADGVYYLSLINAHSTGSACTSIGSS